ncbi:unnamed protein product [Boreogadus saida]
MEMEQALQKKQKQTKFKAKLDRLGSRPLDTLTAKLVGCGKQCPFCKAPCEAGAAFHEAHHVKIHRPKGLGRYRYEDSEELCTSICTSSVFSDGKFRNSDTKGEWHSFKEYKTLYGDWNIPADNSYAASDYWKYVMVRFNKDFAKCYNAEPADIPNEWTTISKEDADRSLKDSFNVK